MNNGYDSVLLIAFGGPAPGCCKKYDVCPGEAHCFVEGIVGKADAQAERLREVTSHYVMLGGFSPFNELAFKQSEALEAALYDRGVGVPVYVGFRHWRPYLHEVILEMAQKGRRRILGIIMAPHQSKVSWDWYQQTVSEAIEMLDGGELHVSYLDPWYLNSGYISAIANLIREVCEGLDPDEFRKPALVFTAHAIPQAAANHSPYTQQFAQTAAAVAEQLGRDDFDLAYQSQTENAPVPWTQPDINSLIRAQKELGVRTIIASPIGFLCDHVEVLYDLDVEAQATAQACGINFLRSSTVGVHPEFIGMLADSTHQRFKAVGFVTPPTDKL